MCTREHGPAHSPQSTDAHPDVQARRDPRQHAQMFAPACKHSRGRNGRPCTARHRHTQTHTHTHTHTHANTRVNPEVEEETQARPASHRCTAQQAWLRKDHTGPGRCTASCPCPSVPPLLPSWNAGMGQVCRVSGLQKAKDPGWDTHGSHTSSCVPPGSGSVVPQSDCKRRTAHSPSSRQRNPWR